MEAEIPEGWTATSLIEVCQEINSGSGFPKKYQGETTGDFPFAKVGDLSKHYRSGKKTINSANNYISIEQQKEIKGRIFLEDTIVFPKIGEALKNNYRLLTKQKMLFDNNVMGVTPNPLLADPEFIYYFLLTQDFGKFSVATAIPSIRRGDIESIELLLPPMPVQKSIVAKIEELFSELDSGIASLKTAQQQLSIYRQSLLKHAFEGKLTEQWRKDNASKLETPEQLLARIQQEREEHYQQQLEEWLQAVKDWEAQGKEGRSPRKPAKLKNTEPLSLNEISELAPIPDSWIWHRFGEFYEMLSGFAFKKSDYSETGVRLFQIANVGFGKTIWDSTAYLPENFKNIYQHLILKEGDLVMALNRPMLGDSLKVAILGRQDSPSILYQRVGKFGFNNPSISKYFLYFLQSPHFTSKLKNELRGVNIPFINQTRLAEYSLPYCSFAEQQEIVNQLEERLSYVEQTEKEIGTALDKAELLRQSILKKAFSGKLLV